MVCEDTLRIRNLPSDLSDEEKKDLLRHFGATKIKIITSSSKDKSTVFAKFESKEMAKSVMLRLHQIPILNCRLCVEFAPHDIGQSKPFKPIQSAQETNKKHFRSFVNKLNAWNSAVGFHQPPPAHLKYVYPKPNRATINNIAHALATVPKFYTQVLHLMNKMNLPPPFSNTPDLPEPTSVPQQESNKNSSNTSESELESDPEDVDKKNKEIIPIKRKLPQMKQVKRPKFIKPPLTPIPTSTKQSEKTEEVFDKVDMQVQRKIELKVSSECLETKTSSNESEQVQIMNSEEIAAENDKEKAAEKNVISEEELNANRIPQKELSVLPVFKDYHPGVPSCKLYIKNIAKSVEVSDLEFIYKRYIEDSSDGDKQSQFDIRLMQEGRMKGQAFVTLDSIQLAQKAVKETNGYILKDKPLVVVFGKSSTNKK